MTGDNFQQTEWIERYLEGTLTLEEKRKFEQRLTSEAAFADEVSLQRKVRAGIRAAGRASRLKQLHATDAQMPAHQPVARTVPLAGQSWPKFYWAIAAGFALLLVPFIVIYTQKRASEQLFTEYFSPYANPDDSMRSDTQLPAQAMRLYADQNYAQALPMLEKMLGNDQSQAAVLFYKGNSHLALHHTDQAIASFEAVLKLPPNAYSEEAEWYLALSHVNANHVRKAKQLLTGITGNPDHPFRSNAQELLNEL